MNSPSIDEALNKAFNLACFILDDRETAIHTVEEAMARLDVTTAAQGKRLYYKPSRSSWMRGERAGRYRNKVLFGEMHLLQRLIYIASEVFEQRKEKTFTDNDAAEREMLIHFVKHLVRITTRRNAFYVTLGINRLLYNYTTAETMETYNAVIQDPARVKDDYYYRSRKGVLMQELKKRFGAILDVSRGPRGEERFQTSAQPGRLAGLVNDCLSFFTPWDTFCCVPAGLNPLVDGIPELSSRGKQVEDKIEVDRIHAVLHPDCYGRLINMLGFDPPERRLEVPHFVLAKDSSATGGGRGGSRRTSDNLTHNELDEIKEHLDDQAARRKRDFAGMLRILVDGNERARLSPSRTASTRFVLDTDAELIEVRAMIDGNDLLLASHLFADRESTNSSKPDITSIVLEGGQKLTIRVSVEPNATDAVVDVEYRQTGLLNAASFFLKHPVSSSSVGGQSSRLRWSPARVVPAIALGFALLVVSVFGVAQFIRSKGAGSSQPTARNSGESSQPGNGIVPAMKEPGEATQSAGQATPVASSTADKNEGTQNASKPLRSIPPGDTQSGDVRSSNDGQAGTKETRDRESVARNLESNQPNSSSSDRNMPRDETTRSLAGDDSVVPLSDVRKIYVEATGDESLRARARQQLVANLNRSDRFISVGTKNDADALLRITVIGIGGQPSRLSVRVVLLNARGEVIWQGANSRGMYTGSYESVAADIVKGLLDGASLNRRR